MSEKMNLDELKGLTIPELLDRSVRLYSDRMSLYAHTGQDFQGITYAELGKKVKDFALGLLEMGLQKGDKVGLISVNRPEWCIAYLGILSANGVTVPLDPALKGSELKHILRESRAKIVAASSRHILDMEEALSDLNTLENIISMDDDDRENVLPFQKVLNKGKESSRELYAPDQEELASLIFTSGTTGSSKGVMLTHKNIMTDIWGVYQTLDIFPEDNFLSVLPIHHTFECTCGFLIPLGKGSRIYYARSLKSKQLLEDIRNTKTTVMIGVPLLFEKMLGGLRKGIKKKSPLTQFLFNTNLGLCGTANKVIGINPGKVLFKGLRDKAGFSTLRFFVCGGAPLSPEIPEFFDLLGIKFLQGYGLTETSPVLSVNPINKIKYASAGPPIPGVDLKVVDPDENGTGEIAARGDIIMKGYYKNDKATAEVLQDDWFLTGDSGWIDKDGYVYVTGRKKDMIVTRAGKNIYPEELEYQLNKSPFILESLVLGRRIGEGKGEEPYAIIVPDYEYFDNVADRGKKEFDEKKIEQTIKEEIANCCSNIADYKRIKGFEIREDEFEKTSTRKIKRYLFKHKIVPIERSKD
jgi:long-chain acyl-CoA synthetase